MNMYVANLGFHITADDLRKLFESFGLVITVKIILDLATGGGRGFGFNKLNGKMEGRFIPIPVVREREERSGKKSW
ncbi:RNA recognition motif domain-containing protein [Terrimonas pollutisoli]|uniref:RNA recognition motif domain-containing protein n=1 Tax=Terrimonas pollutisoli TaxID=3034147 RepID=UPI0023EDE27E|nr:RNA-binding protein [Terrimonas sp. H1YJ31]